MFEQSVLAQARRKSIFNERKEFTMATQSSVGEVQHAIKQGAITREYKADVERVIQALNSLRSTEIMSYLQYMQHQYMAVSLLSPGMKAEFGAHAAQELDHANRLADRVQQLGGVPIYDPREIASKAAHVGISPEQGTTLADMVTEDLMLERQQIEVYSKLIREVGDQDLVTRQLLVSILVETEKHAAELADYLKRSAQH
jgi:bacterioferritin